MALLITDPSNAVLSGVAFTIERGVPSATVAVKIKNTGAIEVAGAYVSLYAEETPGSGFYVTSGNPVVDERMGRFEVTGQDSTATAGQVIVLSQVQTMGHLAVARLPTILPGDWILADIWLEQGTSSASGGSVNVKFEISNDASAIPVAGGVSDSGSGILTELGQPVSFLISGRAVTASGTPDDKVNLASGSYVVNGVPYTDIARQITLNQNDSAAIALVAGERYFAALYQQSGTTYGAVKGLKGVAPAGEIPNFPADSIALGYATVLYGAGGSVIQTADLTLSAFHYGRLLVTYPGTGLSVTVGTGRAITQGFMLLKAFKSTVALTASATNYIWIDVNSSIVVTLTNVPPSAGGALPLATAVTSGSAVTTLTDTRVFAGSASTSVLAHAATHAIAGSDPVSPASIGASATGHTHAEADVTSLVTDLAAKASTAYVDAAVAGLGYAVASKTSNYTAATSDRTILCDTTGGSFTITLYTAVGNTGRSLIIKKTDDSDNTVLVDGNGAETIDGFPDFTLAVEADTVTVQSDGANWRTINFTTFRPNVVDPTFSIGTGAANPFQMPYDQETIFTTPKSAAGAFTMNLPNAGVGGITLLIIKNDSTANVVTIAALAGNSIHDGASTGSFTLGTEGKWVKLVSSGSFGGNKWWVVGKN